eukprot:SAG22_NODE_1931_length_3292_cov_4.886940_5_plen_53_part_01
MRSIRPCRQLVEALEANHWEPCGFAGFHDVNSNTQQAAAASAAAAAAEPPPPP